MPVASRLAPSESAKSLSVMDKRGQQPKPSRLEEHWLPISELGSKAIFQVHAELFIPVIS
jgi:hypothetical protein